MGRENPAHPFVRGDDPTFGARFGGGCVWEDTNRIVCGWPEQAHPAPPAYRVGNHQPQNVYRGDQYIGVMFDPADAAAVVAALNEGE